MGVRIACCTGYSSDGNNRVFPLEKNETFQKGRTNHKLSERVTQKSAVRAGGDAWKGYPVPQCDREVYLTKPKRSRRLPALQGGTDQN